MWKYRIVKRYFTGVLKDINIGNYTNIRFNPRNIYTDCNTKDRYRIVKIEVV